VFPPLRTGRSGTGTSRSLYLRGIVENAKKASGVEIKGMHDMWHHYGSWLLVQGFSIVEVQEMLGHRDVNTTRRYLHLPPDFVSMACGRLDKADLGWDSGKYCGSLVAAGSRKQESGLPV